MDQLYTFHLFAGAGEPLPDDVPDLAREAWQHGERVTRRARR